MAVLKKWDGEADRQTRREPEKVGIFLVMQLSGWTWNNWSDVKRREGWPRLGHKIFCPGLQGTWVCSLPYMAMEMKKKDRTLQQSTAEWMAEGWSKPEPFQMNPGDSGKDVRLSHGGAELWGCRWWQPQEDTRRQKQTATTEWPHSAACYSLCLSSSALPVSRKSSQIRICFTSSAKCGL